MFLLSNMQDNREDFLRALKEDDGVTVKEMIDKGEVDVNAQIKVCMHINLLLCSHRCKS